jgi:hypothetical protein
LTPGLLESFSFFVVPPGTPESLKEITSLSPF